jgi:hypothetical protein
MTYVQKLESCILAMSETAGRRRRLHRVQTDQVGERTNRVAAAQFHAGEDVLGRRQFLLKRKDSALLIIAHRIRSVRRIVQIELAPESLSRILCDYNLS